MSSRKPPVSSSWSSEKARTISVLGELAFHQSRGGGDILPAPAASGSRPHLPLVRGGAEARAFVDAGPCRDCTVVSGRSRARRTAREPPARCRSCPPRGGCPVTEVRPGPVPDLLVRVVARPRRLIVPGRWDRTAHGKGTFDGVSRMWRVTDASAGPSAPHSGKDRRTDARHDERRRDDGVGRRSVPRRSGASGSGGLPAFFTQTGSLCAAIEVRLETGHTCASVQLHHQRTAHLDMELT